MLLTSGQISMTITSSIVFIFTSLLFLSGYVLQQQTVRSLQLAIRPQAPSPVPSSLQSPSVSLKAKVFGNAPGSEGYTPLQQAVTGGSPSVDWAKLAHVQLVRRPLDVCNAVMLFAELSVSESPAQRLLLYPKEWNNAVTGTDYVDPVIETSQRLLRLAAKNYGVSLFPVEPIEGVSDTTATMDIAYPTLRLLSMIEFDRLLLLQPSGILLNVSALDELLTIPANSALTAVSEATGGAIDVIPSGLIIQPSIRSFHEFMVSLRRSSSMEEPQPMYLPDSSSRTATNRYLVWRSSALVVEDERFNRTSFLQQVAYIRLFDSNILGPDYDNPRQDFLASRPNNLKARQIWEDLYESYRTQRMTVCGLDLEPIPKR